MVVQLRSIEIFPRTDYETDTHLSSLGRRGGKEPSHNDRANGCRLVLLLLMKVLYHVNTQYILVCK